MATTVSLNNLKNLLSRMKRIQTQVMQLEEKVASMKAGGSMDAMAEVTRRVQEFKDMYAQRQENATQLKMENAALRQQVNRADFCIQETDKHIRTMQAAGAEGSVEISIEDWGQNSDGPIKLITLRNKTGMSVKIISLGGIIQSIEVPDKSGNVADVVTGFDSCDEYAANHAFFGTITGRYANRIAKGKFTLNGKEFNVPINNGEHALHGGLKGFDKQLWKCAKVDTQDGAGVVMSYVSADGEEGYPGEMAVNVSYLLSTFQNSLTITYEATTTKDTVLNLTNHTYFNLSGKFTRDTMINHELQLNCDTYLPVDAGSIPLGEIATVAGTPFDFRVSKKIGADIASSHAQTSLGPGGYDHNMCINSEGASAPTVCASVFDPLSGRTLEVRTDQPGVQLYTGNYLGGDKGKGGQAYEKQSAFCLETQHYPDSPNQPQFPTTTLVAGDTFKSTTSFSFSCK